MKRVKAPPGAKRLIESLRNLGYDCHTAVADLIDNSIAANASRVVVDINARDGKRPAYILIADDGKGMDREDFFQAMRYGADKEYSIDDLGKYGLGLKTASLSQCSKLTVFTRPKRAYSRPMIYRWDLEHIGKVDDWELLQMDWEDLRPWEQAAIEDQIKNSPGTAILWEELSIAHPLLESNDPEIRDRYLARLDSDVRNHLRVVFHRFLQGVIQGRRKLQVIVGDDPLTPCDPFCRSEEATTELAIEKIPAPNSATKVVVAPFILPREDEFSSKEAWRDASGTRGWNFSQGFYFYRNHRLLQGGGWGRIRTQDEHTKLLRVSIDFPRDLDEAFSLNITKMRARIPAAIRDEIESKLSKWTSQARARYDRRSPKTGRGQPEGPASPAQPISPSKSVRMGPVTIGTGLHLDFKTDQKGGSSLIVPERHPLAEIVVAQNGAKSELKALVAALLLMHETGKRPRGKAWQKFLRHAMKALRT